MLMKTFKIIRMVLTVVDVVCLLAVLFVPALEAAKHNFFVWLILGLLTLYVLFMWLVLGRRNTNGYDAESDREADISKELLSQSLLLLCYLDKRVRNSTIINQIKQAYE